MLAVLAILPSVFFGFYGSNASPIAEDTAGFLDERYRGFLGGMAISVSFVLLLLILLVIGPELVRRFRRR